MRHCVLALVLAVITLQNDSTIVLASTPAAPEAKPAQADLPSGRWSYSVTCLEGSYSGEWELATAPDGTLSGRFMGTNEMDVGTLTGRVQGIRVDFTRRGVHRGATFEQRWSALIGGDAMHGGSILRPAQQGGNCSFTAEAGIPAQAMLAPGRVPGFEYDSERRGGDYRNFELASADPQLCASACAQESQCRAWTYVKPGATAPAARCSLKSIVPTAVSNMNAISGVAR